MILDLVYSSRDFYLSNQVRSKPLYLFGLKAIGQHTRGLCYLVNVLTFIESVIKIGALIKLIFL